MSNNLHFPDPPAKKSKQLIPQDPIKGQWVQQKCADKDCEQMLGHWSNDGNWHYPGAKCEKHNGGKK